MVTRRDPSDAQLGRMHELADGTRVTLRLARPGDHAGMWALALRAQADAHTLALIDGLGTDPRRCVSLCATALVDGAETMLGFGAARLHVEEAVPSAAGRAIGLIGGVLRLGGRGPDVARRPIKPLIVVDPAHADDLTSLIAAALAIRVGLSAPRDNIR